jgi:hypothetical protein
MWLQFASIALDKSHKILVTKEKCDTKLQW